MKILVAGCGSIGSRHARNAAALASVGVADALPERGRALARELGDAPHFATLEAALEWRPDAAIVATPHTTHLSVASRFVGAGIPVLIEKPIADRLDGVDALLDLAARNRVALFVACNMRFHPGVATLREHLPDIGKIYYARASYGNYLPDMRPNADYRELYCARRETGGGVILDAIHEIDYLTWLLGDADAVSAEAGTLGDLDIDVEDYAALHVRHETGARSEIHLDYLQRYKRRGCEIVGAQGTLVWTSEGKDPERCSVRRYDARTRSWETLHESPRLDGNRPYADLLSAFLASAAGKPDARMLGGAQAKRALEIALAAREAVPAAKGGCVATVGKELQ